LGLNKIVRTVDRRTNGGKESQGKHRGRSKIEKENKNLGKRAKLEKSWGVDVRGGWNWEIGGGGVKWRELGKEGEADENLRL
jgi:hypothetical protein